MALTIGDNFSYQGQKPNFERDRFDTLAEMKAFAETSLDDGHLSYCAEDGKHYVFDSSNEEDETTGKWREFTSGISEIPEATDSEYGGIKIGYSESDRNYAVQLDSNGKAYVYVPWSSGGTYSSATSTTAGIVKLGSDTVQTTSANDVTTTSSRTYAVQVNSDGQMVVNVPWSNTTYSTATTSANGLMSSTDKAKLDGIAEGADVTTVTQVLISGTQIASINNIAIYAPAQTTYDVATESSDGLMSSESYKALSTLLSQMSQSGSNRPLIPSVTNSAYSYEDADSGMQASNSEGVVYDSSSGEFTGANDGVNIYPIIPYATGTTGGAMSASDKAKLDTFNVVVNIMTEDEYNALDDKDDNSVYFIKGS